MSNILITGVAGFLGRTLARHYFEQGWDVIGTDIVAPENAPASFLKKYLPAYLPSPAFVQLLKDTKPSICIHCAGRASVGASILRPFEDYIQGPELTFYVLNCLHEALPVCKFVLLSSAAVYGNTLVLPIEENTMPAPISIYGFNKWQSEIICREFFEVYQQPTASVRIFSAYGPGLRRQVIWDICEKAISGDTINLLGTGNESRDFIYSLDIAAGVEAVAKSAGMSGEIYNLASGRQITISYLANLVLDYLQLGKKEILFDAIEPFGNPLNWQADIQKITQLGFSPAIPFEKGLHAYITWFLSECGRGLI